MNRKLLGVLFVGFLVATAGCSMLPGDSEETTTPTTTTGTPTETPTQTTSPTTTAENTNETFSSDLNASNALDSHESHLRAAGSFASTHRINMTQTKPNGESSSINMTTDYRVNLSQNRSWSAQIGGPFSVVREKYTEGDTTYQQMRREGMNASDARYVVDSEPYNSSSRTSLRPVNTTQAMGVTLFVVENVSFKNAGTETYDGVTVTRFEADSPQDIRGVNDAGEFTAPNTPNGTVTTFSAVIHVSEDGVIQHATWSMTIERDSGASVYTSYEFDVADIGSTSVDAPEWLNVAKSKSD